MKSILLFAFLAASVFAAPNALVARSSSKPKKPKYEDDKTYTVEGCAGLASSCGWFWSGECEDFCSAKNKSFGGMTSDDDGCFPTFKRCCCGEVKKDDE
jgi:hypothetical protein